MAFMESYKTNFICIYYAKRYDNNCKSKLETLINFRQFIIKVAPSQRPCPFQCCFELSKFGVRLLFRPSITKGYYILTLIHYCLKNSSVGWMCIAKIAQLHAGDATARHFRRIGFQPRKSLKCYLFQRVKRDSLADEFLA